MLELIAGLPDNVIGVRASGEVTAEDYQAVLVPAVEDVLSRHKRLRLLYLLGREMAGFSSAAAWEDTKTGMRHFTAFERIAVVSDTPWIRHMVQAMGFVIPGEVRIFAEHDLDDAQSWVCAPAEPGTLEVELLEAQRVLVLHPRHELQAADFERVAREIDPFIERVGGLAGVVIIAQEFPGWDDFAAFAAHFRFVREHRRQVRRVALVTCSRFLAVLPRLAQLFVAAEVRRFTFEQHAEALAWAGSAT